METNDSLFCTVEEAVGDLKAGKMIVLTDDEDRENEGDLVCLAEAASADHINFMATHGRGLICLAMAPEHIDRLGLRLMVPENSSRFQTAFTVSIEAAQGVTTGISAHDRALTIQVAIDPKSTSKDVATPGHVFPLRAKKGGVLVRAGQTEGSVDLARLAGAREAAVICEIMNADGTMARLSDLALFCKTHGLKLLTVQQLIAHRLRHETLVKEIASCDLPIEGGSVFEMKVFGSDVDETRHVALVKGEIHPDRPTLVRVHSECLTGDAFGSLRCDCGWQLSSSLEKLSQEGGVLLYMRQEGRGIGLAAKIQAYALQEKGLDTVEANHRLGFKEDHRDYGVGSQILRALGVGKMRLLTNNPRKIYGLHGYGLEIVERVAIESLPTEENQHYLRTKKDRLGHLLSL